MSWLFMVVSVVMLVIAWLLLTQGNKEGATACTALSLCAYQEVRTMMLEQRVADLEKERGG